MGNTFNVETADLDRDTIDLSDRGINSQTAIDIAKRLQGSLKLRYLYLGLNDIGTNGARGLSELVLRHASLKVLDLSSNRISDNGATLLAAAIQSSPGVLEDLRLAHNSITDLGARRLLMAAVHVPSLATIDLTSNRVTNSVLLTACGDLAWARSEHSAGRLESSIERRSSGPSITITDAPVTSKPGFTGAELIDDTRSATSQRVPSFLGSTNMALAIPSQTTGQPIPQSPRATSTPAPVPSPMLQSQNAPDASKSSGVVSSTLSSLNLFPPSTPQHVSVQRSNLRKSIGKPPQIPIKLDLNDVTMSESTEAKESAEWTILPTRMRRAESAYEAPSKKTADTFRAELSPHVEEPETKRDSGQRGRLRTPARPHEKSKQEPEELHPEDLFSLSGTKGNRRSDVTGLGPGTTIGTRMTKTTSSRSTVTQGRHSYHSTAEASASTLTSSTSFSNMSTTQQETRRLQEDLSQLHLGTSSSTLDAEVVDLTRSMSQDQVSSGKFEDHDSIADPVTAETLATFMKERRKAERKDFLERCAATRNAQAQSDEQLSQHETVQYSQPAELPVADVVQAWALRNTVTPLTTPSAIFVSSQTYKSSSKPKAHPYLPYLLRTLHEVYPRISTTGPLLSGPIHVVPPVSQLRTAYRTAILTVHPDRVGPDADPRTKELASCIFPILKASYDRFMATVNPNDS